MAKFWYKNAIIYSLNVRTFLDSNQDGVGDFQGLTRTLDYIAGLGITCVWLLPFYPSPFRDNGYDVSDYLAIDPQYGNLGHFVEFIDAADERGIKVLIDLVVNHTSIDHPWFQSARKDKKSKYYNYYIWTDKLPENNPTKTAFGHEEDGQWAWDDVAKQYYFHSFYEHQADLNLANPDVQEEIKYILYFWLKLGIAGFRMDAVHQMLKPKGNVQWKTDPYQFLKNLREFLEEHRPDSILLAEVDVAPEEYKNFFGEEDQMHILLNFYLNSRIFLSLVRENSHPIIQAIKALPKTKFKEQFGTFLRNHDELNIERLTKEEQQEVFAALGPDKNMQVYDRGIRRRLAPMFNNDRRKLELLYSLLFSLPGTPILWFGEEIGMGEDLSLEERNSVRTAMQWSSEKNGGFSLCSEENLKVPVLNNSNFDYKHVNVHQQMKDPNSLLNWLERIIMIRKEFVEFGYGEFELIQTNNPQVLAHYCYWKDGLSIAVHNLSGKEVTVKLDVTDKKFNHLLEQFGDMSYKPANPQEQEIELCPYGYRWFRKSTLFL